MRTWGTDCRLFLGWLILAAASLVPTAGCHALKLMPANLDKHDKPEKEPVAAVPGQRSFRKSQFLFLSDFEVNKDLALFNELADLREQVYQELELPRSDTLIQVHLFQDRDRYEQFIHAKYPDLPRRRAFFVAQPHTRGAEDLLVYTFWGERIRQDLRHELTHAVLHSVLPDVPLWLDEGLAEYFEVPPHMQGTNQHHLEQARLNTGGSFKPDLAHLEQLRDVQDMTPVEYREAWAWVHLMLRSSPEAKAVLTAYLKELRTNRNPGLLEPRLAAVFPDLKDALDKHLAGLDASRSAGPAVQR
jgi:hypothetical protein